MQAGVASVRAAVPADIPAILSMIEQLARYERLSDLVSAGADRLETHLFGKAKYAEALVAELGGVPAGYALFFHTYSTFLAAPGVYLEDLFVPEENRGRGIGKALLRAVARIAVERGCARLEWAVLDWNEPAIGFYRSAGARQLSDWRTFRLEGARLGKLAEDHE